MSNTLVKGVVFERSGASVLGRIVGHDGQRITRASVSAMQYEVWDVEASPAARVAGPTTLVINSVVFDALQLDARWTLDAVGYNFRLDLPASAFPDAKVYRIEVRLTPLAGQVFRFAFEVDTVDLYGD